MSGTFENTIEVVSIIEKPIKKKMKADKSKLKKSKKEKKKVVEKNKTKKMVKEMEEEKKKNSINCGKALKEEIQEVEKGSSRLVVTNCELFAIAANKYNERSKVAAIE